jgi:hypothetical protein
MRGILGSVVVMATLLAACTPIAPEATTGPPEAPAASPSRGPIRSDAPPSGKPSVKPTASPAPTPPPLAWEKAGRLDVGDGELLGVAKVESGYVAWGHAYPDDAAREEGQWTFATWASSDLRSWTRTDHPSPATWCHGSRPETEWEQAASDGTTLVVVGAHLAPDQTGDDCTTTVAWLATRNGAEWTQGTTDIPGRSDGLWPIPNGWELRGPAKGAAASVWQTSDLLTWTQVGVAARFTGQGPPVVAGDGTRVQQNGWDRNLLVASSDGVTWRTLRRLPGDAYVSAVLPPIPGDDRWIVAIQRPGRAVRLLATAELQRWTGSAFPSGGLDAILRVPGGYIATGYRPNPPPFCEDEICALEVPEQYRQAVVYAAPDGRTWTPHPELRLAKGRMPFLIADGAGVLALEVIGGSSGAHRFWRLVEGS